MYVNCCIPVEFTVSQNPICIHRHLLSGCHGHVVLDTKEKIKSKNTRFCEMKSMACSVMPSLNPI